MAQENSLIAIIEHQKNKIQSLKNRLKDCKTDVENYDNALSMIVDSLGGEIVLSKKVVENIREYPRYYTSNNMFADYHVGLDSSGTDMEHVFTLLKRTGGEND